MALKHCYKVLHVSAVPQRHQAVHLQCEPQWVMVKSNYQEKELRFENLENKMQDRSKANICNFYSSFFIRLLPAFSVVFKKVNRKH